MKRNYIWMLFFVAMCFADDLPRNTYYNRLDRTEPQARETLECKKNGIGIFESAYIGNQL